MRSLLFTLALLPRLLNAIPLWEPTGPYHVGYTQHILNHTTPIDPTPSPGILLLTIYYPTLQAPNPAMAAAEGLRRGANLDGTFQALVDGGTGVPDPGAAVADLGRPFVAVGAEERVRGVWGADETWALWRAGQSGWVRGVQPVIYFCTVLPADYNDPKR
ncbi:putative paf acetylhydrolase family protein [Neofusicoccum parvum]|nr:putative paf acetylhydrolase family protein [Neofusicoccum parvum]